MTRTSMQTALTWLDELEVLLQQSCVEERLEQRMQDFPSDVNRKIMIKNLDDDICRWTYLCELFMCDRPTN